MDLEEFVNDIIEAFHTTVSDDDYVNERAAKATIWGLVEKFEADVASLYQLEINRLRELSVV